MDAPSRDDWRLALGHDWFVPVRIVNTAAIASRVVGTVGTGGLPNWFRVREHWRAIRDEGVPCILERHDDGNWTLRSADGAAAFDVPLHAVKPTGDRAEFDRIILKINEEAA